jgi:Flp pilus assembly protein CpaB
MWKVKRMNTARIVVLTIAVGAGGVAAYLANGSDSKPAPAELVAQLQTVDVLVAKADIGLGQMVTPDDMHHPDRRLTQNSVVGKTATLGLKPEQTSLLAAGALSLALRGIADLNAVDIRLDEQSARRGNINGVRYSVSNPITMQQRPKGLNA